MKIFFIVSLLIILIGCTKKQVNMDESAVESEPQLVENHEFNLDNGGEFYRYNEIKNVGTYETGPISIEIELAETLKGSMTEELKSSEEYQDLELISILMKFDLNEQLDEINDDIKFNSKKNIHIVTDTGEEILQPDSLLSSVVDIGILKTNQEADESPFLRDFMFQLKESNAEEIKQATLLIDAPVDSEGNAAGEPLEIEIDFSKE